MGNFPLHSDRQQRGECLPDRAKLETLCGKDTRIRRTTGPIDRTTTTLASPASAFSVSCECHRIRMNALIFTEG